MKRLIVIGIAVVALAVPALAMAGSAKVYVANLTSLNAGTHVDASGETFNIPAASGTATITLSGDDVTVTISAQGMDPFTLHPQHIHAGPACPAPSTDPNLDTYLDVLEGLPSYGKILVNLDSDLTSNAAGTFPTSDANGTYEYSASGSRTHIQDEIKTALKLGTRHVVLHGIAERELPSTVQSIGTLPAYLTLPVACGELVSTN